MRERLPNRRHNERRQFAWRAPDGSVHLFQVDVGFYPDGRAGEVFASGPKTGSVLRAVIEDGCVMASHLAQLGMSFESQALALGRQADGTPASPMGGILELAAKIASHVIADAAGKPIETPA